MEPCQTSDCRCSLMQTEVSPDSYQVPEELSPFLQKNAGTRLRKGKSARLRLWLTLKRIPAVSRPRIPKSIAEV